MNKNNQAHIWDYPSLDGISRSLEHQERFVKHVKQESQMVKNTETTANIIVNERNAAK